MIRAAGFFLLIDIPRVHLREAARFWSTVTGWPLTEPHGERGEFIPLTSDGADAWVCLQGVDRENGGVHLDLAVDNPRDAVERATDLGASHQRSLDGVDVMSSPGNLPFCLLPAVSNAPLQRDTTSILDQVCIDIPDRLWDTEVGFWSAVTGREVTPGAQSEFASLVGPPTAPRILLQRLKGEDGPVRAHPDFAVADRHEETARHLAAGAEVLVEFDWWTVLLAPGGQVYCLTERAPATGTATDQQVS